MELILNNSHSYMGVIQILNGSYSHLNFELRIWIVGSYLTLQLQPFIMSRRMVVGGTFLKFAPRHHIDIDLKKHVKIR